MTTGFSVRAYLRRILDRRHIARVNRRLRRREPETFARLEALIARYRTGDALAHPLQVYKLWELERLLDRFTPDRIIEFGTGSTTPILAGHVLGRPGGSLLAVDEDANWLEHTRSLLPPAAIEGDVVRLARRDKVIRADSDPPEIRYEPPPTGAFDLALIDGPSLHGPDGRKVPGAVNTNVADLIDNAPPRVVVIDMRTDTVRWFQERFGSAYRSEISDRVLKRRTLDYRYLTVFERIDA